jgi:hypothetical protein
MIYADQYKIISPAMGEDFAHNFKNLAGSSDQFNQPNRIPHICGKKTCLNMREGA